jgi:heparan-alpha-glucosaminide N-acetyltransferase
MYIERDLAPAVLPKIKTGIEMSDTAVKETHGPDIPIIAPAGERTAARNVAVDAYRGFVMVLMMAEVLQLAQVARAFPGNWFWAFLGYNQTHVEWAAVRSTT